MAKFKNLRTIIIERLLEAFNFIRSAKIHRAAVWILGEYCTSTTDIQAVMNEIRQSLGEIPIVEDELRKAAGEEQMEDESVQASGGQAVQKLVTADGTYATQSAFIGGSAAGAGGGKAKGAQDDKDRPPLRRYLMDGDFFIGASLATVLTKLSVRYGAAVGSGPDAEKKRSRFNAESMLVLASIMHLVSYSATKTGLTWS